MTVQEIGNFETDNNGNFITTMKIPNNISEERIEFKIKNNQGEEKIVSLRLGDNENRMEEFIKRHCLYYVILNRIW